MTVPPTNQPFPPLTLVPRENPFDTIFDRGTPTAPRGRFVVVIALDEGRYQALSMALGASHITAVAAHSESEAVRLLNSRTGLAVVVGGDAAAVAVIARSVRSSVSARGVPIIGWLAARTLVPVSTQLVASGVDAVLDDRHAASDVIATIGDRRQRIDGSLADDMLLSGQRLLDVIPTAIFIVDANGAVAWCNGAALELTARTTNFTQDALFGPFLQLFGGADAPNVAACLAETTTAEIGYTSQVAITMGVGPYAVPVTLQFSRLGELGLGWAVAVVAVPTPAHRGPALPARSSFEQLSTIVRPLIRGLHMITNTLLGLRDHARTNAGTPTAVDEQSLLFEARTLVELVDLLHREDTPDPADYVDLATVCDEQFALLRKAVAIPIVHRQTDQGKPCLIKADAVTVARILSMAVLYLLRQAERTGSLTAFLSAQSGEAELRLLYCAGPMPLTFPPAHPALALPVSDPSLRVISRLTRELGGSLLVSDGPRSTQQIQLRLPLAPEPRKPALRSW